VIRIDSLPQAIECVYLADNPNLVRVPDFVLGLPNLFVFTVDEDVPQPLEFRRFLKQQRNNRAQPIALADDNIANIIYHGTEAQVEIFNQYEDNMENLIIRENNFANDQELEPEPEVIDDGFDDFEEPDGNLNIFSDSQNVHDTTIQSSLTSSISSLIKGESFTEEELYDSLMESGLCLSIIKEIMNSFNDYTIHDATQMSYMDVFRYVFKYICNSEHYDDLLQILENEVIDGSDLCFVGRLTRLVNVLSGYHEGVNLTIDDKSQIGNIAILLSSKYSGDELKEVFTKEMKERGFPDETISEWVDYL